VPFRLTRIEVPATRQGLEKLAMVRREELDGFIEGLFGDREKIDLPERAHKAVEVLADVRAMAEATQEIAKDTSKPAELADIVGTLGHFREMTRIAELEIYAAVLSCTRARRQMLPTHKAARPVVH